MFDFPAQFVEKSNDQSLAFVEKLWATRRIGELIDQLDLNGHNQELVKELVALSTKHGILTPYTSFLADESVRPDVASAGNQVRGRRANWNRYKPLGRKGRRGAARGQAGDEGGAQHRESGGAATDGRLRQARRTTSMRRRQTGRREQRSQPRQPGALPARQDRRDARHGESRLSRRTAAQITTVDRYSTEYFALVTGNTVEENQIFSNQAPDEELLVRLRGKAYLIK